MKARVHRIAADLATVDVHSLRYRPLHPEDYAEMMELHSEWFPVVYHDSFYQKSTNGEIFTLAATTRTERDEGTDNDEIIGMVTMSTKCEHHANDIKHVLGDDCAVLCEGSGSLAYILTLGVVDECRRKGIARRLLKRLISQVEQMPHVQALYLHVVPYNGAAVHLYESMGFLRVATFETFYQIHGQPYGSYLYALYLNGARPPFRWRVRKFLGIVFEATWREWLISQWQSLWRGDVAKPVECEGP